MSTRVGEIAGYRGVGQRADGRRDIGRSFLTVLGLLLLGYAFLGKGFAYFGVQPLLVAEMTLLLGLVALHRSGCAFASILSFPALLMLGLFVLTLGHVLVDIPVYGMAAARDGIMVFYALFAFAVIAVLIEDEARLAFLLKRYLAFATIYAMVGVVSPHVTIALLDYMPPFPGTQEPLIAVRLGEAAVHLAGAAIIFLLGLRRPTPLIVFLLSLSFFALMPSRGASLAFVAAVFAAAVLSGNVMRFVPPLVVAAVVFAVALALDFNIQINEERAIGARQLVSNFESLFGDSDYSNLSGTKEWRLHWWGTIIDYTVFGDYFWTGKGFGMSLAEADGFVVGLEHGGPILRSPHNIHMTILARLGVPGALLWGGMLASWWLLMLYNMALAYRRGDGQWAALFIWIACYIGGIILNASVDVALEGPMQGVWFWSLIGLGLAMSMIYRFRIDKARGGRVAGPLEG